MALIHVSPYEADKIIKNGATIVDVRGVDEFKQEHIENAQNIPLHMLPEVTFPRGTKILFHCKSGKRTTINADILEQASVNAYVLEGGIDAWKAAGLKVKR